MATIQEIKTKLLNANALGRTNLSEKGVELPETAATYEIMSKIAEVVGGGGMAPLDNTVTFTVEGETVEIVSVKEGNSVNIPVSIKDSNGFLYKWTLNGERIKFPYTPTESVILEGTPLGSLVPPDINDWQKNTVAQEAYICIDFNGNENTVSYKGVGGYEYIYYPVSFKANRRYVFSITFKTKNLSYSTYSQPHSPFISVSKDLSTDVYATQYRVALVSTVMNSTPDTEYATYSLTYDSFEEFEGYAVFDTGNITDGMNGVLYIKDISLYAADLTSNG